MWHCHVTRRDISTFSWKAAEPIRRSESPSQTSICSVCPRRYWLNTRPSPGCIYDGSNRYRNWKKTPSILLIKILNYTMNKVTYQKISHVNKLLRGQMFTIYLHCKTKFSQKISIWCSKSEKNQQTGNCAGLLLHQTTKQAALFF